ncbi:MAG: FG-GAP-like repeat-containing protein [Marinoscillum sp.]
MKRILTTVIALTTFMAVYAQVNIQNSLIGHFPFDGSTLDTTGTFTSPVSTDIAYGTDRNSEASGALLLNGTTSTMELGEQLDATNNFAISLWFNRSTAGVREILVAKYADTGCGENNRQFFLEISANNKLGINLQGTLTGGNGSFWESTSTVSASGEWHHVTFQYLASGSVELYFDGVKETLVNTINAADKIMAAGTAPLSLGGAISFARDCIILPFTGLLDDVTIHSRKLNPLEILELSDTEFFILQSATPPTNSTISSAENFTFSFNQNTGTPVAGNFTINSKLKGTLNPTISNNNNQVTFTLSALAPGDEITISVDTSFHNDTDNLSLYQSNVFQYKVETTLANETPVVFSYPAENLFAGSGTDYLATKAVDYDLDGDIDLAATSAAGFLGFFSNDGTGSLTRIGLTNSFSGGTSVEAADLDGDGDIDAIASRVNQISYYRNDGAGVYTLASLLTYLGTGYIKLADLEGDGDLDIVAYTHTTGSGNVSYFLNDGTGAFGTQTVIYTANGIYDVSIGDVDNDFDLDLLVVEEASTPAKGVRLVKNNGNLSFSSSIVKQLPWNNGAFPNGIAHACKLSDLNGDGSLDIVLVSRANSTGTSTLTWYPNDGSGGFGDILAFNQISAYSGSTFNSTINLNTGDVDGDGDQDIVVSMRQGLNRTYLYQNNGDNTFTQQLMGTEYPTSIAGIFPPEIADLSGDGIMDVVFGAAGDIKLFRNLDILTLISSVPANGAIDVANTDDITLTFDLPVDASSVAGNIQLNDSEGAIDFTHAVSANTITISPSEILPSGKSISVVIGNILGTGGEIISAGSGIQFTTYQFKSVANYPLQGQPMVKNDTSIVIDFNLDVFADSVDNESFRVHSHYRPSIPGSFTVSGSRVTFTPDQPFWSNENIKVDLSSKVTSTSGLTLTGHTYFEFFAAASGIAENTLSFKKYDFGTHISGQVNTHTIPFDKDGDGDIDLIYNNLPSGKWHSGTNTDGVGSFDVSNNDFVPTLSINDYFGIIEDFDKNGTLDFHNVTKVASIHQHLFMPGASGATSLKLIQGVNGVSSYASMDVSDYNHDGTNNIFFMSETNQPKFVSSFFDKNGIKTYLASEITGIGTISRPIWLKTFDIDRDGYDDLMLTDYKSGTNAEFQIYLNNQQGGFNLDTAITIANAVYFEPYDMDLDGDLDIVVTNNGRHEFNILVNDGSMRFTSTTISNADANQYGGMLFFAIGDMNLDGLPDIVYESFNNGAVSVLTSTGDLANFNFTNANFSGSNPGVINATFISLADMDNDGDLDIFCGQENSLDGSNQLQPIVILKNNIIQLSEPPVALTGISDLEFDEDNVFDLTLNFDTLFSDPEEDELTYSLTSSTTSIEATIENGQTIHIVPIANYSGTSTVSLIASDGAGIARIDITVIVNPVNDAPHGKDTTVLINEDINYIFQTDDFEINDVDSPLQALAELQIVSLPSVGSLQLEGVVISVGAVISPSQINAVVYSPGENGNGLAYDSFTFKVSDGVVYAELANIFTFDVNPVNDAPEFLLDESVIARAKNFGTETISLTDLSPENESDQTIIYSMTPSSVSFATVTIDPATGALTISSLTDQVGEVELTITADDGQASNNTYSSTLTFTVIDNLAPIASAEIDDVTLEEDSAPFTLVSDLSAIFSDPDGDALTFSTSSSEQGLVASVDANQGVIIELATNFFGSAMVTVSASDGSLTTSLEVTIAVTGINDAPILSNPTTDQQATEGIPFVLPYPENNFTDPDGDVVSIAEVSIEGLNGTTGSWLNYSFETRVFSGTPNQSNVGTTHVILTASDGELTTTDQYFVIVADVNSAPVVMNQLSVTMNEDEAALDIDLNTIFFDEDGDILTFAIANETGESSLVFPTLTNNTLTLSPMLDAFGSVSIMVSASDGRSESPTFYMIPVFILSVNDAPVLDIPVDDFTIFQDESFSFVLPSNQFYDVESEALNISVTFTASWLTYGSNEGKESGSFFGTPTASDLGSYEITVTASDGELSVEDRFLITVLATNNSPTSISLSSSTINEGESSPQTVGVLTTTDPDVEDAHTYMLVNREGTVTDNAQFMITNTDEVFELKFTGVANFDTRSTYLVAIQSIDLAGASIIQEFTITVNPEIILGEKANTIVVYPNPATNSIMVQAKQGKVLIYDLSGHLLMEGPINKKISLEGLDNGVYLIQIQDGDNTITKRLIKQN